MGSKKRKKVNSNIEKEYKAFFYDSDSHRGGYASLSYRKIDGFSYSMIGKNDHSDFVLILEVMGIEIDFDAWQVDNLCSDPDGLDDEIVKLYGDRESRLANYVKIYGKGPDCGSIHFVRSNCLPEDAHTLYRKIDELSEAYYTFQYPDDEKKRNEFRNCGHISSPAEDAYVREYFEYPSHLYDSEPALRRDYGNGVKRKEDGTVDWEDWNNRIENIGKVLG